MPLVPLRDGSRLYVRVFGRGQPVLMLPGLGMASSSLLVIVNALRLVSNDGAPESDTRISMIPSA